MMRRFVEIPIIFIVKITMKMNEKQKQSEIRSIDGNPLFKI